MVIEFFLKITIFRDFHYVALKSYNRLPKQFYSTTTTKQKTKTKTKVKIEVKMNFQQLNVDRPLKTPPRISAIVLSSVLFVASL